MELISTNDQVFVIAKKNIFWKNFGSQKRMERVLFFFREEEEKRNLTRSRVNHHRRINRNY